MSLTTTQLVIEHQGKSYSGIFSVSGTTMIGRIPGIGSKAKEVNPDADVEHYRNDAKALFIEMLEAVETQRPPINA